jgi:hypothetical protein
MIKDMKNIYSRRMRISRLPLSDDSLSLGLYNKHFRGLNNFRGDLGIVHAGTRTISHAFRLWATVILKIG